MNVPRQVFPVPSPKAPLVEVRRTFQGLDDNNLGNAVMVPSGASNVALLRAHGQDDLIDTISINLGYEIDAVEIPGGPALAVNPTATLKWGVGGASYRVVMDLLLGMVVNIAATSLEISVSNPAPVGQTGAQIKAMASLGFGGVGRPYSNPARFTEVLGDLDPAQSVIVPIPAFAVSYNVFTTSAPPVLSNLATVQSSSPTNVVALTQTSSPTFDQTSGSVSLVRSARGLVVTNNNPGVATGVRVVFTLSL